MELRYAASEFRLLVRHNGRRMLRNSASEDALDVPGMMARAEEVGGRLKFKRRILAGSEIEIRVPGHLAFGLHSMDRVTRRPGWLHGRK